MERRERRKVDAMNAAHEDTCQCRKAEQHVANLAKPRFVQRDGGQRMRTTS
jgi:hypothetical protein